MRQMSISRAFLLAASMSVVTCANSNAASAPRAEAGTPSVGLCEKGRAVSVLSAGTWYSAKVLDGPGRMGTCLVSYDGYGSNWDEWVNLDRIKPAAGRSAAATSRTAPKRAAATDVKSTTVVPGVVPAGKYSCYTFDNGLLNYAYTDILVKANGRYAVGNQEGRYSMSEGGTLRFTGPMANASGKFSLKNGGKPQIDLVFNKDARASMSCPKSA